MLRGRQRVMLLGYGFGVIWSHPGFEAICIFEFRIQCFGIISDICAKSATPRNFLKLPKSSIIFLSPFKSRKDIRCNARRVEVQK
jgi:hypothetical protein